MRGAMAGAIVLASALLCLGVAAPGQASGGVPRAPAFVMGAPTGDVGVRGVLAAATLSSRAAYVATGRNLAVTRDKPNCQARPLPACSREYPVFIIEVPLVAPVVTTAVFAGSAREADRLLGEFRDDPAGEVLIDRPRALAMKYATAGKDDDWLITYYRAQGGYVAVGSCYGLRAKESAVTTCARDLARAVADRLPGRAP